MSGFRRRGRGSGQGQAANEDTRTRILLAVVDGARSYGDIMDATLLPRSTIHPHLHVLIGRGLVAMEKGRQGTIRPLVRQVPFSAPRSVST